MLTWMSLLAAKHKGVYMYSDSSWLSPTDLIVNQHAHSHTTHNPVTLCNYLKQKLATYTSLKIKSKYSWLKSKQEYKSATSSLQQ